MTGYAHLDYAQSLAEFGHPLFLPRCRGWLLQRQIPRTTAADAMGCYPLFACQDWSQLEADLANLSRTLVSVTLVTDPFGAFDDRLLRHCFDQVRLFKHHFVIDLSRPFSEVVSAHHRRNVRKATAKVWVEPCNRPLQYLDQWCTLYNTLIERHKIRGLLRFSRQAFARQLQVPGLEMFRAVHNQATVGITLWYVDHAMGYYHLGAYSPSGYRLGASFALFWQAMATFAGRGLRWLNLGAGAGVEPGSSDGLTRFKRGWASDSRPVYLCGRILDQQRYQEISQARGLAGTTYFPAYRQGEFASQ